MRKHLLLMTLFVSTLIFAQGEVEPCASYDKKVEENFVLRGEVKRLHEDSLKHEATINTLAQDTAQLGKKLRTNEKIQKDAEQCLKQNEKLKKQLKDCKDTEIIKHKVDSLETISKSLNGRVKELNDSISRINEQLNEIAKLHSIIAYLDERFANKSVEVLYKTTERNELNTCASIYKKTDKEVPENIQLTIACFDAEKHASDKYNKARIDKAIASLPKSTEAAIKITKCLQDYAVVNKEANDLWINIKTEVCSGEIPNDDFTQIQKKRQIWQRTQKFLNQYPNLATDYPYVFDQLQTMLRQIWVNANNFNSIKNPFE